MQLKKSRVLLILFFGIILSITNMLSATMVYADVDDFERVPGNNVSGNTQQNMPEDDNLENPEDVYIDENNDNDEEEPLLTDSEKKSANIKKIIIAGAVAGSLIIISSGIILVLVRKKSKLKI